jgi:hypothetical protein
MNARTIQAIALATTIGASALGGSMLPGLMRQSEEDGLRYTTEAVEGAPPWVAVGTAIGALRGLIVDILWIKVNYMKDQGLFFEVMADAELITKLQPRFAAVWIFHGHNMAYNISVATHTMAERWEWVQAGIRLVRNEGLRHNPNSMALHRDLAFWFAHKIEGVSDDAHMYYKTELAREWHYLLGEPPETWDDRLAWIRTVADAPNSLEEAERRTPGVAALIERFNGAMGEFGEEFEYASTAAFLLRYGEWRAVIKDTEIAEILGVREDYRRSRASFAAFDDVAGDPEVAEQWDTLIAFTRRRALLDEYNMDPRFMADLTEELGPIDWRSGYAHALYWSRLGERRASIGVSDVNSIYVALNNDRQQLQSIQGLARAGRIMFDPFSGETMPSRFPEPRFVDTIARLFPVYYEKHFDTRGAGGEGFIGFLQNFMASAVRESYRSGEFARAQELMDQLDERFGTGAPVGMQNPRFSQPLEVFVREEIAGELEFQPLLAPSEVFASMRRAYRVGVGRDREDIWANCLTFVAQVVTIFKENQYFDYVNKFGVGRVADMLQDTPTIVREAFKNVMVDQSIPLEERVNIWARVDRFPGAELARAYAYDDVITDLRRQLSRHPLGQRYSAAQLFPPPPNLQRIRQQIAAAEAARQAREAAEQARDEIQRR